MFLTVESLAIEIFVIIVYAEIGKGRLCKFKKVKASKWDLLSMKF